LVECPGATETISVYASHACSVREVLDMVSDISGHAMQVVVNPAFVRAGEVELLCGSHEKLERMVGPIDWIPLRETLRWMLEAAD
jgi:UDP-glucose 4-epimerase